jgi:hypothetical protein
MGFLLAEVLPPNRIASGLIALRPSAAWADAVGIAAAVAAIAYQVLRVPTKHPIAAS